jgi:outer membrane protein assembly factor BamB
MNKLLTVAAIAMLAAAVAPLSAQDPTRLYSAPPALPREALDRLRLTTAWTFTVPTDGRRDGLFSVQVAPRAGGQELLVQTRSGSVTSLDATTGRVLWTARLGAPYRVAQPVGYNRRSVFVINNIVLYALDRDNGSVQWQFELPSGAIAPPVADEDQVYLSLSNDRVKVYALPNIAQWEQQARKNKAAANTSAMEAARVLKGGNNLPAIGPLSSIHDAYRPVPSGPQPAESFSYVPDDTIEGPPVVGQQRIMLAAVGGGITGLARGAPRAAWELRARGRIRVPAGQYDDIAYVASTDFTLYAVDIDAGRVLWRLPSGGRPSDQPAVLDEDVYLAVDGSRLIRARRADAEESWQNDDAARFLAAGKHFVYGADRAGRLVVIDRARGTTLSTYDGTRDFVFPVQNELTDRLYLASNDGRIVCLHDRDSERPLVMKTVKERQPPRPGKPGAAEPPPGKPGAKEKEPPKDAGEGAKPKEPAGEGMEKKP